MLRMLLEVLDRMAEPAKEKVLLPIWRFGWGDLAIAEFMVEGDREIERLRKVVAKKSWRVLEEEPERGWYRRWLSGYRGWVGFGGVEKKVLTACEWQTEAGLTAAGIALERYRLKNGEYPERLEQLVPEFLEAVPTDWFCGEALRYRRDAERGFRLYGVGRNGVDDGGEGGFARAGRTASVLASTRFAAPSLWGDDLVWPARGTEEQRRKAVEEQEKRVRDLGSSPYGMDPALMRRYGLVPRGGTGTFQMSPELMRRYGLLPKGGATYTAPAPAPPPVPPVGK